MPTYQLTYRYKQSSRIDAGVSASILVTIVTFIKLITHGASDINHSIDFNRLVANGSTENNNKKGASG